MIEPVPLPGFEFVPPDVAQEEVPDAERRMFTPEDEEVDLDPDQFELEF